MWAEKEMHNLVKMSKGGIRYDGQEEAGRLMMVSRQGARGGDPQEARPGDVLPRTGG